MAELSHLDTSGRAVMVDVGDKPVSRRYARARGALLVSPATLEKISRGSFSKGDVFGVARLAGITAAKKTGDLIPLCHPLPLDWVGVELLPLAPDKVVIVGEAAAQGRTGIEMEALTAVSVAALTLYDMCKAVDRGMKIDGVALLEKSGGRSGHFFEQQRCLPLPAIDSPFSLAAGSQVRVQLSADRAGLHCEGGLTLNFPSLSPVLSSDRQPARWLALGSLLLQLEPQEDDGIIYKIWRPGILRSPGLLIRLD